MKSNRLLSLEPNAPRNASVKKNFTRVPNIILSECPMTPYERLIVAYILKFETCFAGQRRMAAELGMSRPTVQRTLTRLQKFNVVGKTKRQGLSVYWFVRGPSKWTYPNFEVGTEA